MHKLRRLWKKVRVNKRRREPTKFVYRSSIGDDADSYRSDDGSAHDEHDEHDNLHVDSQVDSHSDTVSESISDPDLANVSDSEWWQDQSPAESHEQDKHHKYNRQRRVSNMRKLRSQWSRRHGRNPRRAKPNGQGMPVRKKLLDTYVCCADKEQVPTEANGRQAIDITKQEPEIDFSPAVKSSMLPAASDL